MWLNQRIVLIDTVWKTVSENLTGSFPQSFHETFRGRMAKLAVEEF